MTTTTRRRLDVTPIALGLWALSLCALSGCASAESGVAPVPATASVDPAAQRFVDCLNANGVDAILDQDGRVMYGVGTPDGETSVTAGDAAEKGRADAEKTCAQSVPDYTPRDDDER